MAKTTANNVNILMEKPAIYIMKKAAISEMGIARYRDQGRSPVTQEQKNNQHDQNKSFKNRILYLINGITNKNSIIIGYSRLQYPQVNPAANHP